jgi:DNA-binding NtrC family response regulator
MPDRIGLVGQADGSTLFLDELAELPQAGQAHLLRVLDGGEYHRLGEATARRSSFRLVAATNRDPSALKPDLAGRLMLRLVVPPLAALREDIPLLVRHIVRRAAVQGDPIAQALLPGGAPQAEPALEPELVRGLLAREYALNVRELELLLWHRVGAVRLPSTLEIEAAAPEASRDGGGPLEAEAEDCGGDSVPSAARIQRCLDDHNGSLERTWRALGLRNRFVLLRLIKKHALEVRKRPGQARGR